MCLCSKAHTFDVSHIDVLRSDQNVCCKKCPLMTVNYFGYHSTTNSYCSDVWMCSSNKRVVINDYWNEPTEAERRIYALKDWTTNCSDNGLSPAWRQAIIWTNAGILLNNCWNKFQWNLNQNAYISIPENAFENVWKMTAILSRARWVKAWWGNYILPNPWDALYAITAIAIMVSFGMVE